MKKFCLLPVFFVFLCFFVFGETDEREEIDFLLFAPNSGELFVNEDQAMIQLDNLAKYLIGRNLIPGQIYVYGYASAAINDIDSVSLSRDRASFVINELQKRGVPKDLFSDPVAYGEVDLWGGNTSEEDRIPNRRVRIVLDGNVLTPAVLKAVDTEPVTSGSDDTAAARENSQAESGSDFPWWILLPLLLLAALIFFLLKRGKRAAGKPIPDNEPEKAEEPIPAVVKSETFVKNLEEEIRFRAYELYQQRNGRNEDAEGDWYIALPEVCARYEAAGYQVYAEAGNWWARKTIYR